jgi:Ni/Fe-hydrogenase subunit HybB-like protein
MPAFLSKLLQRAFLVAALLGVFGYLLAEVYLLTQRMHGMTPDADSTAVRWRAPINMAIMGVSLLVVLEMIALALRKKKPTEPARSIDEIPLPPVPPPEPKQPS